MCPGKDREQVTAQRVIPGGTEADENAAAGLEQRIHGFQNGAGVRKMLEGVERDDDLYGIGDGSNKFAFGADSGLLCLFPTNLQPLLSDVETDHAFGTEQRHLFHFHTGAAAEIQNYLVFDFRFDSGQQNPEFAFTLVGFTAHCGRNPGSNQTQEMILKRGKHTRSLMIPNGEWGCRLTTGCLRSWPRGVMETVIKSGLEERGRSLAFGNSEKPDVETGQTGNSGRASSQWDFQVG